jgi:hypothetical protein
MLTKLGTKVLVTSCMTNRVRTIYGGFSAIQQVRHHEIKLGATCLFLVTIQDKISNSNFVFPEHCNVSLNPITAFEKK